MFTKYWNMYPRWRGKPYLIVEVAMDSKMKKNGLYQNEDGVGFVESLVAIAVGGIASIALFSVAMMVIRESNYNEMRDAMNMYAIDGMEKVRVQASQAYNTLPRCNTENPESPVKGYLSEGFVVELESTDDFCSDIGDEIGKCERLRMPKGTEDIFYREVKLMGTGDNPVKDDQCIKMRVEVTVGLLVNAGEEDPPRGNLPEKTIVGYIAK